MDDTTPNTSPETNGQPHADGESVAELKRRIAELEVALAAMTRQREETRRMFFELYDHVFPDDPPPTEAELLEERKTLVPGTISDFIAEFERRQAENSGTRPRASSPFTTPDPLAIPCSPHFWLRRSPAAGRKHLPRG
jgi:hypothetical protein